MARFSPTIHPWNQHLWQQLTDEPERSAHALLFNGPEGLGKLALGFSLAHFVISETAGQSENLFNGGSHPDLHVLMPEEFLLERPEGDLLAQFAQRYTEQHSGKPKRVIGIELIRQLTESMTTHPHIASHRVVLIAHAEKMNRNAANALLKNLEEPPANTLFILVCDEISKLPKTIRSRCSLVNFRTPEQSVAKQWLTAQSIMPEHEMDSHLAMANNQPLLAVRLYESAYVDALKTVFTDVNGLWSRKRDPVSVAKNLQEIGGLRAVEILQKLMVDLLKSSLTAEPEGVFFPIQSSWVQSSAGKVSRTNLLATIDELNEAKRLLATTVDPLLVLETVSNKIRQMPV